MSKIHHLTSVYLLWHTRVDGDDEDDKLLGVFSSQENAEEAKQNALTKAGFKDYPDGFCIDEYTINQQKWLDGFVTIDLT